MKEKDEREVLVSYYTLDNNIIILINQLMLKRHSTLDNKSKIKKNKLTECLTELDKCLQISVDDRLVIRHRIKEDDPELYQLFQTHRKEKNYTQLQIKLRKILAGIKSAEKRNNTHFIDPNRKSQYNQRIYSQNSQNNSYKNSLKSSPQKQKQPKKATIYFDISELHKKIKQSKTNRSINRQKEVLKERSISSSKLNISIHLPKNIEAVKKLEKGDKESSVLSQRNLGEFKNKMNDKSKSHYRNKENEIIREDGQVRQGSREKKVQRKTSEVNLKQNCVSYSSSIKAILMNKIKEKKLSEQNILKESKRHNLQNNHDQQMNKVEINTAIKKPETIEKVDQAWELNTIAKNPARPILRDQLSVVQTCDDEINKFPMYIKASSRAAENEQTQMKLQSLGYKNYRRNVVNKDINVQRRLFMQEQSKVGQFYKRIKEVIDKK